MILITGGVFQGKLDFARERYGLRPEEIFRCTETDVDFSRRCICNLEAYTRACAREGRDSRSLFEQAPEAWKDRILICRDISGGVVPLGADMRAWQRENGSLCQYLAERADRVLRIFCGLEQRLK